MNEIKVALIVTDFLCAPSEISETLRVDPTRTWLKGDSIDPRTIAVRQENGWCVESSMGIDSSLNDQLHDLMGILKPKERNFEKLPEGCHIELSCTVYVVSEAPELHLDRTAVEFLKSIGAEFDLDMYCLAGD